MQEFMKADVFFFITSIAVIIVSVGVSIALYYIVRILKNVRDVTDRVEEGTKALAEDVSELRTSLKRQGFAWGSLFTFLKKYSRWSGEKPSRKTSESD